MTTPEELKILEWWERRQVFLREVFWLSTAVSAYYCGMPASATRSIAAHLVQANGSGMT